MKTENQQMQNQKSKLLQSIIDSDDLLKKQIQSNKPPTDQEPIDHQQSKVQYSQIGESKSAGKSNLANRKNFVSLNKQAVIGYRRLPLHYSSQITSRSVRKSKKPYKLAIGESSGSFSNNNNRSSLGATYTLNQDDPWRITAVENCPPPTRVYFTGAPLPCRVLNDCKSIMTDTAASVNDGAADNADSFLSFPAQKPEKDVTTEKGHEEKKCSEYHKGSNGHSSAALAPQNMTESKKKWPAMASGNSSHLTASINNLRETLQEIRLIALSKGDDTLNRLAFDGQFLTETILKESHRKPKPVVVKEEKLSNDKITMSQAQDVSSDPRSVPIDKVRDNPNHRKVLVRKDQSPSINRHEIALLQAKNGKLQRSLASKKEEVNQLKCQYQSVIMQLCSKDSDILQLKHHHAQEALLLKEKNTSLESEVEKLRDEVHKLKTTVDQLTTNVNKSNSVINSVRDHFRHQLLHWKVDSECAPLSQLSMQNDSNMVDDTTKPLNSSEMLQRVMNLLEDVDHSKYQTTVPEPSDHSSWTNYYKPHSISPHSTVQAPNDNRGGLSTARSSASGSVASWLLDDVESASTAIPIPFSENQAIDSSADTNEQQTPRLNSYLSSLEHGDPVVLRHGASDCNLSFTSVSTFKSIDERQFTHGLAKLDAQIARLQKVLQIS